MSEVDRYPHWVRWSEEDQVYIGRCPDLFRGGVHGDDPAAVYQDLRYAMEDCADQLPLPPASRWPDHRPPSGRPLVIGGGDDEDADALPYQERDVAEAIAEVESA